MNNTTVADQMYPILEELYAVQAAIEGVFNATTGNGMRCESGAAHADALAKGAFRVLDGAVAKMERLLAD